MNQGGGGSKEIGKFIATLKAQIYQCPRCRLMKLEDSKLRQAAEENQAAAEQAAEEQATDNQTALEDIKIDTESEHEIEPEIKPEEYFKLTSEQEQILNSIFASKN